MKRVLTLFLLLSLCLSLFSCGGASLNFVTDSIKPYISFDLSDLKGGSYELTDTYGVYDAARAERKFRDDRLNAATPIGVKNEGTVAFGDAAHLYYEVALTENGEGAFSNVYTGEGTQTLFLGYWEFLDQLPEDEYHPVFYNKTLSDFVTGMSVIPHITEGTVNAGDKVRVSYVCYDEKGIATEQASNVRIDTANLSLYEETEYPRFFLESLTGKTLGEKYEITGTKTVKNADGATTETTVKYAVTPMYTVEEVFETVAVTLAPDTYDAEDGEAFTALNGKTVYFRVMLESYYAFTTPALTDTFLMETYGFVTGKTDPNEVLEVATEKLILLAAEKREEALREQALSVVMSKIRDEGGVRKYPKEQYDSYYDELYESLVQRHLEAREDALANGEVFTMTVEQYAIYYLTYYGYYDAEEYSSLDEYLEAQVESELDAKIILMGAAQLAELRLSEKEYRALMEEELQKSLESEIANGNTTVTREELIEAAGGEEEALLIMVLDHAEKAVMEYIYKNNTWSIKEGSDS